MDLNKIPLYPQDLEEIKTEAKQWLELHYGANMPAGQARAMARDVLRLLNHIEKLESNRV